jgi:DNA repair protein RAD5
MVDCPDKLYSGVDLLISLSVYILPEAFKPLRLGDDAKSFSSGGVWFNEGKETDEEQILRDRKSALEMLFKTIGLRPHREGSAAQKNEGALKQSGKLDVKGKGVDRSREVLYVDEDEDEDEDDILSENELDVIYKRYFGPKCSLPM